MSTVAIESVAPHITTIRLERPDRLNAISFDLVADLHSALDTVSNDADCKVVILTGAGRGFCSGLDLKDWGKVPEPGEHPHINAGIDGQTFMSNLTVHMRNTPQVIIDTLRGVNPWVDQADFDHHGYGLAKVTRNTFDVTLKRVSTIKERSTATETTDGFRYRVERGQKSIKGVNGPAA